MFELLWLVDFYHVVQWEERYNEVFLPFLSWLIQNLFRILAAIYNFYTALYRSYVSQRIDVGEHVVVWSSIQLFSSEISDTCFDDGYCSVHLDPWERLVRIFSFFNEVVWFSWGGGTPLHYCIHGILSRTWGQVPSGLGIDTGYQIGG